MEQKNIIIVGAGISATVAALELIAAGERVTILERQSEARSGGLAPWSFGGLFFADSPTQRAKKIKDSLELAWEDWQACAEFGGEDDLPRAWAQRYIEHSVPKIHDWLQGLGISYLPVVNWIERGLFTHGNTVPRFHMVWGTGRELMRVLQSALMQHPNAHSHLEMVYEHKVTELVTQQGRVVGVRGEKTSALEGNTAFEMQAQTVMIAAGGLGGNIEALRKNWPQAWGGQAKQPSLILNGAAPEIDGSLHDAAQHAGARVTHLDWLWPYAGGIHHPQPRHPNHGLSTVPMRSALWMNFQGRRMGPVPVPASSYDTKYAVTRICEEEKVHSWQIANQKILRKEFAISGSEHNKVIREKSKIGLIKQLLLGNQELVDDMLAHCVDFVQADSLDELAQKMNALQGNADVDAEGMKRDIRAYDAQIKRGKKFHNDDQLRRIAQLRGYVGDRVRTCNFQTIEDESAKPYVAIRLHICSRKTLGGIQTDLFSRVTQAGDARGTTPPVIEGLYAIGEAAGYGGGGMNGQAALEGTFLGGCMYTARVAAHHLIGKTL